ncbi:conserved hypothetical protein [Thioalkalivibrio sulfidiphilus HL-EbGr7]|uniref:Uncharacterized protein n=2 Tax=Thioalkalivibrio TaxID=106633 RepID=B8GS34_THISH|nr:conserved hypothetical protein [Thioalkalivibrio sulfidiphilus HL-EbGr7]
MAKEQPTAAQWQEIEERVMTLFSSVHLDCDGYLVRLMLQRVGKLRLGITVYVDGKFDLKWLGWVGDELSEEGRRFYQERTRSVYRGKRKKLARRALGKKAAEETVSHRHPYWESPQSLRRHLVANNEVIRLLSDEEAKRRREALLADEVAS